MSTYSEDTAEQIRAFLASMQPRRDGIDDLAQYQRGREAVELLATHSKGDDPMPGIILPLSKCADILSFLRKLEPAEPFLDPPGAPKFIEGRNWWEDPEDETNHVCGFHIVLRALEQSIRRRGSGEETSASNITSLSPPQSEGREEFSTLEAQLTLCRQTLTCATVALGKAEDESFEGDTGPTAIRVLEQCVEDLLRFEQHLNGWYTKQRTTGGRS